MIEEIAECYSMNNRLCQMAEECAELTQVCMKLQRDDVDRNVWNINLCEELADVQIMIEQLLAKMSPVQRRMYADFKKSKIERSAKRAGVL